MATSSRQATPKQAAAYQRKVMLEDLRMRLRAKIFELGEAKDDVDNTRDEWNEQIDVCRRLDAELRLAVEERDSLRDRFDSYHDEMARIVQEVNDIERQLTALERE